MPANSSIKNKPSPPACITFAFANAADLDALVAIECQSFPSPWTRQNFAGELEQPFSRTLVARRTDSPGQEIVGYLIYWSIVDEMHILNLAVSPAWRRLGIARGLLQEAIRLARADHLQTAWLEVRPSNQAALALYQSLGFKPAMTRKGYYGDTGEDAVILRRSL